MQQLNVKALIQLKATRDRLTVQQYKTLRGQVFAGDADGAMRGLRKILERGKVRPAKRGGVKS